ncbi:MAG: preprotein translocase subunit SecY [Chitinophagaceae bacterium]|nr:MAG: preprotein translocase subunit SecY [Chitinophagaceae bacterium]
MKKLITTLKNIWSIEELRGKILFTLSLIVVYRLGSHIVLPGINPLTLEAIAANSEQNGILDLINTFAGGAFNQASFLALGIMPYITASIFMQLMTVLVPSFQKMQKEGESGRKKVNQITRYLTVLVTFVQAFAYVSYLRQTAGQAIDPSLSAISFTVLTVTLLTAGTLFVMWLGEKITDKGIGNGTSLIIMAGIIARLPQSFFQELELRSTRSGDILIFIVEIALFIAIVMGCIMLTLAVRKVPVNYAKQIIGGKQIGGARQFLPLKVNAANVMPIIFAQALMFIPTLFTMGNPNSHLGRMFTDHTSGWYMLVYSIIVIGFTFLYTALIFNPRQISDNLKQNNGFIPGVKPGQPTTDFIGQIMDRITLPGAIMLAILGILPGLVQVAFGMSQGFAMFFGGTSLLIMVGVILDTLEQIETQLMMRQYDGLMTTGRIQGRQSASSITGM